MYQLDEIKLLEAHESEVLCLEYSSVDNGRFSLSHCIYLFNPSSTTDNLQQTTIKKFAAFSKITNKA